MIVIDADNQILGRIAVVAAKQALLGENVIVVNCEKSVISGNKEYVFAKYKRKRDMGVPKRGPYMSRMPDRLSRRVIRGMLPMANARGKEAFERVMCYIGTPERLRQEKMTVVPGADAAKLPTLKKVTMGEICKHLGASWNE